MTYTEEFIPTEQGQGSNEESAYPTAFGITFTPLIGGIILAVLGLAGAAYLMLNLVKPVWDRHQELEKTLSDKQTELTTKQRQVQNIPAQRTKLAEAKQQNKEVLALFSNEKTLDTLMLDINRFVDSRQGKLIKFAPEQQTANAANTANTASGFTIVNDGSLGPQINGKLKRKTVAVELEGSFDQIQSIMRSLERLQQLLLVKDFKADLDKSTQKIVLDQQGKVVSVGQAATTIKTSFKLQALMPLAPEDAAAAAAVQPKK